MKLLILSAPLLLCVTALPQNPTVRRAEDLYRHGLVEDAKRDAITLIHSSGGGQIQNRARMLLARIALDEDRLADAAELWREVVKSTDTTYAPQARQMLTRFADALTEVGVQRIDNAVARSYFTAAEFWLSKLPSTFAVDTSWLVDESASTYWLDRIIREFPGSDAAELAHQYRVRVLLGTSGHGSKGLGGTGALGAISRLERDPSDEQLKTFEDYMRRAENALRNMADNFPKSGHLQRLRYMIVQAYLRLGKRENAEPLLKAIVQAAGNHETFWKHVAQLRLRG